MSANRSIKMFTVLLLALITAVIVLVAVVPSALGQEANGRSKRNIAIEVIENGTRWVPDETPADEDGMPVYGTEFITQGYIYPAGTITCEDNQCNGVLEDGSPEFPDLVIGTWLCRGWTLGDAQTTSGPVVITTQLFDLGDMPSEETIVTDGYELADFNLEFQRAITGGTGRYRLARGVQIQEFLGWNPTLGVALGIELKLARR